MISTEWLAVRVQKTTCKNRFAATTSDADIENCKVSWMRDTWMAPCNGEQYLPPLTQHLCFVPVHRSYCTESLFLRPVITYLVHCLALFCLNVWTLLLSFLLPYKHAASTVINMGLYAHDDLLPHTIVLFNVQSSLVITCNRPCITRKVVIVHYAFS